MRARPRHPDAADADEMDRGRELHESPDFAAAQRFTRERIASRGSSATSCSAAARIAASAAGCKASRSSRSSRAPSSSRSGTTRALPPARHDLGVVGLMIARGMRVRHEQSRRRRRAQLAERRCARTRHHEIGGGVGGARIVEIGHDVNRARRLPRTFRNARVVRARPSRAGSAIRAAACRAPRTRPPHRSASAHLGCRPSPRPSSSADRARARRALQAPASHATWKRARACRSPLPSLPNCGRAPRRSTRSRRRAARANDSSSPASRSLRAARSWRARDAERARDAAPRSPGRRRIRPSPPQRPA